MPEYATFEDFARHVFLDLKHFEISSSDRVKLIRQPICTELFHQASFALQIFAHAHSEFFLRSFAKSHKQVLKTDEQFFKFAIPRCLKLIDDKRYFYSLVLVACFLKEYLNFLSETRVCYRFHFTAYKCLAAVFERSFKNSFDSNGGWNGFGKYLQRVIEAKIASGDGCILSVLNEGDTILCERVKGIIHHCDDIPDGFKLNEYEMSLLMDDDVKEIEKSLKNDKAGTDPLNLSWPPDKEMNKKLMIKKSMKSLNDLYTRMDISGFLVPSDDINGIKGMDDSKEDNCLDYLSILLEYIYKIKAEAEILLGTEEFLKKMKLRLCPCCGIKCYQFSMKLLTKQIDLAITNKALGNALEKKSQIKSNL